MKFPLGLKYTKYHQWVRVENNRAVIGLTDYAQDALGNIVYIFISKVGLPVKQGEVIGEIESMKAVSLINSPLPGKILEVNEVVVLSPSLINEDPYEKGWLFSIEMSEPNEVLSLMDTEEYRLFLNEK